MSFTCQTRRQFLDSTAALGAGLWLGGSPKIRAASPNEKLNVACIGVGGRGAANVGGVSGESIVAMCDVDENKAGARFQQFDKAARFQDFRVMLDKLDKKIDAVVVSTPDHAHFHPARQAMLMGKHVYCEKPLAHSVWECRELTKLAKKMDVATQLGNQRHANPGMARTVEAVQSGMIGDVTEVYCAIGGSRGMPAVPQEFPAVPGHLNWDLWQGPVKERPYSPEYCPYKWRFWWDYGTGEAGNFGCHILDIPFWALQLKYPNRVDLDVVPTAEEIDPLRTPKSMKTRLEFPAEVGHGPVTLHWWHGALDEVFRQHNTAKYGNTLFIGTKGTMAAGFDGYRVKLNDGSDAATPEQTIAASPGFHKEWINACKGGPRSSCDFVDYTGPLAESVLLANAAFRSGAGFDWDAGAFAASGNDNIDQFLTPVFRRGWEVEALPGT
ncbi:MAG: Gfo/Idh/MocA family oxidoreductase [Fuerstiella sp.]|nr:Gfo/Idh/MocA family oxidoreductase [Fuerstiella sp.]